MGIIIDREFIKIRSLKLIKNRVHLEAKKLNKRMKAKDHARDNRQNLVFLDSNLRFIIKL